MKLRLEFPTALVFPVQRAGSPARAAETGAGFVNCTELHKPSPYDIARSKPIDRDKGEVPCQVGMRARSGRLQGSM